MILLYFKHEKKITRKIHILKKSNLKTKLNFNEYKYINTH